MVRKWKWYLLTVYACFSIFLVTVRHNCIMHMLLYVNLEDKRIRSNVMCRDATYS